LQEHSSIKEADDFEETTKATEGINLEEGTTIKSAIIQKSKNYILAILRM